MLLTPLYLNDDITNLYKSNSQYDSVTNYILYLLRSGICKVKFIKADGSLRDMICTNNPDVIRILINDIKEDRLRSNSRVNDSVTRTYSIDSSGFRTLTFDRIKYIEIITPDMLNDKLIHYISEKNLKELKNVHIQL